MEFGAILSLGTLGELWRRELPTNKVLFFQNSFALRKEILMLQIFLLQFGLEATSHKSHYEAASTEHQRRYGHAI